MPAWVNGWPLVAAIVLSACGGANGNSGNPSANGGSANDGGGASNGGGGNGGGGNGGGAARVDPAVSANYSWSECGRIERSTRPLAALYASDDSVLTLEASGRVRLFASGSAASTTLITAGVASAFGLVLSPDGRRLLSAGMSAGIGIFARTDREPITAGTGPLTEIASLDVASEGCGGVRSFSTDSALVVTGAWGTVCAWDAETGELQHKLMIPAGDGVRASRWLAVPGQLMVWGSGQLIHYSVDGQVQAQVTTPQGAPPTAIDAAFTADGRHLLLLYPYVLWGTPMPATLVAIETETGAELWRRELDASALSFSLSPDGTAVLVPEGPLLRISDGELLGTDPPAMFREVAALGPGGKRELRLHEQVIEWDLAASKLLGLYGSHIERIRDLDLSRDGRYLASHGNRATVWRIADDFARSRPLYNGAAADDSWNVALAADGQVLAVSGDNVALFSSDGKFWHAGPPQSGVIGGCLSADWSFSPVASWVVGTHYGAALELYDTRDMQLTTTLPAANCNGGVSFSSDGSKLVTASLELYDTATWTRSWSTAPVNTKGRIAEDAVQFSPDASELVITRCLETSWPSCSSARHSAVDGSLLGVLPGLRGMRARYSPEGHWVVSGNQALHVPSGRLVAFTSSIGETVFAPNGDIIAGENDGALVRYCRSLP